MKRTECKSIAYRMYCYAWQCPKCSEVNLRQEKPDLGQDDICDGCQWAIRIMQIHLERIADDLKN